MDYSKPLSKEQESILADYSANDMKKLKQMSDKIIQKLGDIEQFHFDDFYSIANLELMKAVFSYDKRKCDNFHNYLKSNCDRKFCTYLRDMQRKCRSDCETFYKDGKKVVINHKDKRLDAPVAEDNTNTVSDMIAGSSMEDMFDSQIISDEACLKYIKRLSRKQRIVLQCLLNGYTKQAQIKEQTGFSLKVIRECMNALKDSNNTRFLYKWEA